LLTAGHAWTYADASQPIATLITGVVCAVRFEDIDNRLMQQIRCLDEHAKASRWTKSSGP